MKIVIFGSVVQDLISYTQQFPRPGESVIGSAFLMGPGGKGANQAVAAAKLGAHVQIIARVGADIFGDANIKSLADSKVGTENVIKLKDTSTATAATTVSEEGENSIVVVLGANNQMNSDVANEYVDQIAEAKLLMCQNEVPQCGTKTALQIARKHGVTTFYNPTPGNRSLDKSILEFVDIVCTNENEAEFLTGIESSTREGSFERRNRNVLRGIMKILNAHNAAEKMHTLGPHTTIITLGPKGVVLARKGQTTVDIPVSKVKASDTTGAGDCFCGSLAYYLTEMEDIRFEEAVKRPRRVSFHVHQYREKLRDTGGLGPVRSKYISLERGKRRGMSRRLQHACSLKDMDPAYVLKKAELVTSMLNILQKFNREPNVSDGAVVQRLTKAMDNLLVECENFCKLHEELNMNKAGEPTSSAARPLMVIKKNLLGEEPK